MTLCPSNELLTGLLADSLSAAERDAVVRHVEGCVLCQEKLAGLTGIPDTEMWLRAEHPSQGTEDEDAIVRRLKQLPPSSAPGHMARAEGPAGSLHHAVAPVPAAVDSERPAVPGYEILGELGRGGMGVVYQAQQLALQRTVALKMILTKADTGPNAIARFRAEAEVIARLQHPNIVQIYDIGEAADRPYFALEFVAGGNLAQRLGGTPQPVRPAAKMIETLARAVHAAHANGVVHRDLKPANILLQMADLAELKPPDRPEAAAGISGICHLQSVIPKITDFGVAKCIDGDQESPGLRAATVTGELLGTPNYMAPEQAATPRRPVGPAADVYALGAILYEMLAGRPPFTGETPLETVLQLLHNEPVSVTRLQPNVPRDVETICLKCLQKEPRQRYASAAALADDLHRFLDGDPIHAHPTPAWERAWKWAQRRPAVVALSAAIVLLTLASLVLVTLLWLRAEDKAAQAGRAEQAAEQRRKMAQQAEARLAFQQGHALCEQGDIGRGLLWFARSLDRAISAGASELDWPLRVNLAAWGGSLRPQESRLHNPAGVLALSFDPTGRLFGAGGKDGRVYFWDMESGKQTGPLLEPPRPTPKAWVGCVEYSSDHRTIATSSNGYVVLWDAATGKQIGEPLVHPPGMIWGMTYLPDGRLASCSDDGTLRVWDTASHRLVLGPLRHADHSGYYTLAAAPDGHSLVTAGQDGRVVRWDIDKGTPLNPVLQHGSCVLKAVFLGSDKLITATRGGTLHAWDVLQGRAVDLPPQGSEITALALAPDGKLFATGTGFGIVRLWRTASLRAFGPVYRQRSGVSALTFSPDGRSLVLGMESGEIRIVQLPPALEAAPDARLPSEVNTLQYTRDGKRLLVGTPHGALWLDASTGRPLGELLKNPEDFQVDWVALSPDGESMAMGRWAGRLSDWRGRAELWDARSRRRRWQSPEQPGPVGGVAYSPDGRSLFS